MDNSRESTGTPAGSNDSLTADDGKGSLIVTMLSVMMFLQFFAWGSWFATLSAAMDTHLLGAFIGGAYEAAPIAAIFAPLFLGLVADRFFSSERVMATLMLIGGAIMLMVPGMAEN